MTGVEERELSAKNVTQVEETGCGKDMKRNGLWRRLSADVDHDVVNCVAIKVRG